MEEANDLSASVKRMQQAARNKSMRAEQSTTGAAAAPPRRTSRSADTAIDSAARELTEQIPETPHRSSDEFRDWRKDAGLV